ncbi:hypothetical protein TNCV_2306981 [Trichonephila clavipes]|nr:hypothetical protein TNCV_2306981 [Trichonephila clavipes]
MANNQSVRRHLDAFTRGRIIGKLEEGRSLTSMAAEFELLTASFHDFGDNFKLQEQLSRGSVGVGPRGTTPADDRYIVLQARRNRRRRRNRQDRPDTQATGRPPISRFTVARRLHGGGMFQPCTVCTFNARPSEKAFSVVPKHRELDNIKWMYYTLQIEQRFSLSSDSHHIPFERAGKPQSSPETSLKGTGMEVAVFSFGESHHAW